MKTKFFAKLLVGGKSSEEKKPVAATLVNRAPQRRSDGPARRPGENSSVYTRKLEFDDLDIKGVQMMFMAEEEIGRLSEVNIKHDDKEEKTGNLSGTISDPRMYPNSRGVVCSTCLLPEIICPGHLGRIELVRPIINIWAYKQVISVLESICHECGTLLMEPDTAKRYPRVPDRLKKIADASKSLSCRNQKCPNYENQNPSIIKHMDTMIKIRLVYSNGTHKSMTSTRILQLLKNLTSEELEALGFSQNTVYYNHPKNMIFTFLPVLPINHRPDAIIDDSKEVRLDTLTTTYHSIVSINNLLRSKIKKDRMTMDSLEGKVCSLHFRDRDAAKTGNPASIDTSKNIMELISKKDGLIRSKAMSKRCDHTGRTVLGPADPSVKFGYIRLPDFMSSILVEEKICDQNRDYFNGLLEEGRIEQVSDQRVGSLSFKRKDDFLLQNGMVIKRPLQTGDPIIFNRNPTLHKHSMMGYIAKMGKGLNIGVHSSNTSPHNADFDGDEGNVHSCPGYQARAEIFYIAGCWNNIVGSQFSRPMMGLVYNSISSAYLLSDAKEIDDWTWDLIVNHTFGSNRDRIDDTEGFDSLFKRARRQRPQDKTPKNGPVLLSTLFPQDFYYRHGGVLIKEGILVSGRVGKKHIGVSVKSIIHELFHYYGSTVAARFISEGQSLFDLYLERRGFTVGYRDCAMPNTEKDVKEILKAEQEKAQKIIDNRAPLRDSPHPEIQEFYMQSIEAALNSVNPIGEEIIKKALVETNALKIMADSGAKGKAADVAQVIGMVGQQFLREGKRPPMHINRTSSGEGLRFLPIYDIVREGRPEKITSRGFVPRPLGKGMAPGHMVAHMMASRIGLIDTAFGTQTTGYSQRVLAKALEDVRYNYNGTIGGDLGQVIQYAGGGDSFEPMNMVQASAGGYGQIWSPVDISSLVEKLNAEI